MTWYEDSALIGVRHKHSRDAAKLTLRMRATLIGVPLAVAAVALVLGTGTVTAAPLGQTEDFAAPTVAGVPHEIVVGPEGNLWFTESTASRIGEINPYTDESADFATPTPSSRPQGITVGPEGYIWFTEASASKIGVINPATHETADFATPTASAEPAVITLGPEGRVWFTEPAVSGIGVINPVTHATADFPTPTASSAPEGIVAGPEGKLWFTEATPSRIGYIVPSTHETADYETPTASADPLRIVAAPEGKLWFTEGAVSKIGYIVASTHETADFTTPTASSPPTGITIGPEGYVWFGERTVNRVGYIDPATDETDDYAAPTASSEPFGITTAPDGNLWFTESAASRVGYVGAGAPEALVTPPAISGNAQAGSEQTCTAAQWSSFASQQPLTTLFPFDGFQWLANGAPLSGQTADTYSPTGAEVGQTLACRESVSYALTKVDAVATSTGVTVTAVPSTAAQTSASGQAVPAPKLAVTGNVAPISGEVTVRVPGSSTFVALSSLRQVPFGTVINATNGHVSVTTTQPNGTTQTGEFFAGEFTLAQNAAGMVQAALTGGKFNVCRKATRRSRSARASSGHAPGGHIVRKLWANAHGRFSTKGRYVTTTVEGTEWLTEDLCKGTLVRVTRDKVAVTNLVNHRRVTVLAGHKYLAKAP